MKTLILGLALVAIVGLGWHTVAQAAPTTPTVYVNQRLNVITFSPGTTVLPHAGTVVWVEQPSPSNVPDVSISAKSPIGAEEFYPALQPCSSHQAPCWVTPEGP